MLLPVVATAVALGLLAPFTFAILWRVPFGFLPTTLVLRSSLVTALGTFVIAVLVEGVAGVEGPMSGYHGAIVGGIFMATMSLLRARRSRELRGVLLLAVRVGDPATRERATELLTAAMARAKPAPDASDTAFAGYLQLTMMVVSALSTAECFAEAAAHLETLDEARLDDEQGALVAQALATCRVRTGDTIGARRALGRVPRPVQKEAIERWMLTLGALLDAIDGEGETALAAIEALGEVDDDALGASLHLVRAHAFAALGRDDEAREQLEALQAATGGAGLAQALLPEGPATALAEALASAD